MNFKNFYRSMFLVLAFLNPISSFAVSDELRNQIYVEFAKKIGTSEELNELFNFKNPKSESICYLVPLYNDDEHKNCMVDLFAKPESDDESDNNKSKEDYMKYYFNDRDKGLPNKEDVEQKFYVNALKRVWPDDNNLPKSLNFVMDIDGKSVGRIGIGPMFPSDKVDCEIGYAILQEYSGKGYTLSAVRCAIRFLKFLIGKKIYKISRLRATAQKDNKASNYILTKLEFSKQDETYNDVCGPVVEYFYDLRNSCQNNSQILKVPKIIKNIIFK